MCVFDQYSLNARYQYYNFSRGLWRARNLTLELQPTSCYLFILTFSFIICVTFLYKYIVYINIVFICRYAFP